jgi:lipoprotein-anchoring transpeptidase ErfK/SrfK
LHHSAASGPVISTATAATLGDSLYMNAQLRATRIAAIFLFGVISIPFGHAAEAAKPRVKAEFEAAARLQIFLDRAEFAPGKIDGRYGEFTQKALALYRQAHGGKNAEELPPIAEGKAKGKGESAPDVSGLDLAGIDPVFVTYHVTETDLRSIGEVPASVPEQAKMKSLPYRDAAEAIAEKFHTDVDFLAELNPGKTKSIQVGDALLVPNVEPFDLSAVSDLKPGSDLSARAANEADDEAEPKKPEPKNQKKEPANELGAVKASVKIDTKTNMLAVYTGEKLIAAYPVTIGSEETESPIGEWTVRGVEKMPKFRYDKSMLNKGERSGNFHMLPPGPNNPVGVLWIALNKKGIGMHGTNDPDQIGRSASHGCVRLANWDVVRLAEKVKAGARVEIR